MPIIQDAFKYKDHVFMTADRDGVAILIHDVTGKEIEINIDDITFFPPAEDCLHVVIETYYWYKEMYDHCESENLHPSGKEVPEFLGDDLSPDELKEYFNTQTQKLIENHFESETIH